MVTILFFAFAGLAALLAMTNWRRGWILAVLVGLLQDPARKLTSGTPVAMTFTVMIVYAAIVVAAHRELHAAVAEFSKRFPSIARGIMITLLFVLIAAATGLLNFGLLHWKVPMLSLFIYVAPVPAVLFGYIYPRSDTVIYRFLTIYAVITSVWLIGALLEYLRVQFPGLGLVALYGDYIRHLPGIQIRMVSGFYRAPDIMAWHAATLASIAIAMATRAGVSARVWPWIAVAGWGFFNCLISGRRKAVYFVAVFAAVFVWRFFRRMQQAQLWSIAFAALAMVVVVHNLASGEESSVYTRGSLTTREEVFHRLEGGLVETFRQFGIMGAGLGAATQGVRHLLPSQAGLGWQEGGLGKLAVEIGLPGVLAVAALAWALIRLSLTLTRIGDVPGSPQLLRVTLFALLTANVANFMASAQAYTDPVLALMSAFLLGCFFATAALDERVAEAQPPATTQPAFVAA